VTLSNIASSASYDLEIYGNAITQYESAIKEKRNELYWSHTGVRLKNGRFEVFHREVLPEHIIWAALAGAYEAKGDRGKAPRFEKRFEQGWTTSVWTGPRPGPTDRSRQIGPGPRPDHGSVRSRSHTSWTNRSDWTRPVGPM